MLLIKKFNRAHHC